MEYDTVYVRWSNFTAAMPDGSSSQELLEQSVILRCLMRLACIPLLPILH